jgi:hypothetical protein
MTHLWCVEPEVERKMTIVAHKKLLHAFAKGRPLYTAWSFSARSFSTSCKSKGLMSGKFRRQMYRIGNVILRSTKLGKYLIVSEGVLASA